MAVHEDHVTEEEKVVAALTRLLGREVSMGPATHLRDDLGLDSAQLIELTVLVHTMYGIDLGRRAAERKIVPETVDSLILLLRAP